MSAWTNMDIDIIIRNLADRPDTYVNFTLEKILEVRTFTINEQITLLVFLFTEYKHLVRCVHHYRPDCDEQSCTGNIFKILDTWGEAWTYIIVNQLAHYAGYDQDLYNLGVLLR